MNYVCSNCGSPCGQDTRMGLDVYLVCHCTSNSNSVWIDDGRGGYHSYLNDAHPIPANQFKGSGSNSSSQQAGWICTRCGKSNALHVNSCSCT